MQILNNKIYSKRRRKCSAVVIDSYLQKQSSQLVDVILQVERRRRIHKLFQFFNAFITGKTFVECYAFRIGIVVNKDIKVEIFVVTETPDAVSTYILKK